MICNRNEEMMVEKCPPRAVETKYGGAMRMLKQKRKPLPLKNEAQLNCISLRSELDCEVSCEAVRGQDERPLRGALDSPATHHGRPTLTSENKLRGRHVGLDFYDLLIEIEANEWQETCF
jgi:hypothetical protein